MKTNSQRKASRRRQSRFSTHLRFKRVRRKASAILIVLFTIGLTMTLSYAMIRMQHSVATVQQNFSLSGKAQQTAMSASIIAVKKIQDGAWAGPGTTLTGSLGPQESYTISYTAGDSELSPSHPDWADNPFRLTITTTASVSSSDGSGTTAEHTETLTVRLIPEQLSDEPTDWTTFQNYTLYQTGLGHLKIDPPSQIAGPVKLQGDLAIPDHYPTLELLSTTIDLLFIVTSSTSPTAPENERKSQFEAWGFNVTLLTATSSASSYDSAATNNNVAYVSEECAASDVGTKLTDFTIGVVNENFELYDELEISTSGTTKNKFSISILDDSHYITSGFGVGSLDFLSFSDSMTKLGTNLAQDLTVLAEVQNGASLAVLEKGGVISGSNTAAGRRVILPFGGSSFDFGGITTDGLTIVKRAIEWAAADTDTQQLFYEGLAGIAQSSSNDYRPFTGTVTSDSNSFANSERTLEKLEDWLTLTVNDTPATLPAVDWTHSINFTTYRIYEGGQTYNVEQISTPTLSVDLSPDPATNPLGIYYRDGDLTISNNVTVNGTLIVKDSLTVNGTNVTLNARDIEPLEGTTSPIRLPTVVCDDFNVAEECSGSVTGLMAVFGILKCQKGTIDNAFQITGRVILGESLEIHEHNSWKDLDYKSLANAFVSQSTFTYFPDYIVNVESNSLQPRFSLNPDTGKTYHWITSTSGAPIFVKPTGSSGLHFQIIRWGN